MCRKAIQLAILNRGFTGIATEPTNDMLRNIFIPEFEIALNEWGIDYKLNKAISTFTLYINGSESKVICLSAENYERLVGINAAWAVMDEVDTSKQEIAEKAYQKILGRLRTGSVRQLCIFSTPEGFKFCYKCFVKDKNIGEKRLIKAKTTDNKYLPSDFIETLKEQYPPNLLDAYLNGNFVNLANASIYTYFDRYKHHKSITIEDSEVLHVGQDFNISGCVSTLFVIRDNIPFMFDEIISNDTYEVVSNIKNKYKNHICIYPDASGHQGHPNATLTDIQILRNSGFTVMATKQNPRVQDRINSVNGLFSHNKLFIDTNKCPRTTQALEQQSYDEKGNPEKSNSHPSNDDFNDSLGYFVYYKYPLNRTKLSSHEFIL